MVSGYVLLGWSVRKCRVTTDRSKVDIDHQSKVDIDSWQHQIKLDIGHQIKVDIDSWCHQKKLDIESWRHQRWGDAAPSVKVMWPDDVT